MTDKQIVILVSCIGLIALSIGGLFIMRSGPTPAALLTPIPSPLVIVNSSIDAVPASSTPMVQPAHIPDPEVSIAPIRVAAAPTTATIEIPKSKESAPRPPPQPKPFRGLTWGERLTSRADMIVTDNSPVPFIPISVALDDGGSVSIPELHERTFQRSNDKKQFGTETVGSIGYQACDGRFYKVTIHDIVPSGLATVFSQVYGRATESHLGDTEYWSWFADNGQTAVTICDVPISDACPHGITFATITNVKIEAELNAVRKAEAIQALKKSMKDF